MPLKLPLPIAEIKTKSPFGFVSKKPWEELLEIASQFGGVISVHTDPKWGGSFKHLATVRKRTKLPILAKGIHATDAEIVEALNCGADWVLVVGRVPDIAVNSLLIEPLNISQLVDVPNGYRIVWNSRDLETGNLKLQSFGMARKMKQRSWMCQASNIKSLADIDPSADAFLVGEHLENIHREIMELAEFKIGQAVVATQSIMGAKPTEKPYIVKDEAYTIESVYFRSDVLLGSDFVFKLKETKRSPTGEYFRSDCFRAATPLEVIRKRTNG